MLPISSIKPSLREVFHKTEPPRSIYRRLLQVAWSTGHVTRVYVLDEPLCRPLLISFSFYKSRLLLKPGEPLERKRDNTASETSVTRHRKCPSKQTKPRKLRKFNRSATINESDTRDRHPTLDKGISTIMILD